jgi:hypothetical protein
VIIRRCQQCGTTESPEWRRGPKGSGSLCNACGLHFAKIIKRKVNASPSVSLKSAIEIAKMKEDIGETPTLSENPQGGDDNTNNGSN